MRVPPLAAGYVQNPRANRKSENVNEPGDFRAIGDRIKNRLVLPEVMGVEGRLPPLPGLGQKNTGSLYAPNTSSIAARIS